MDDRNEARRYEGACHCGAVKFAVTTALDGLGQCNCSRCRRLGWVMQSAPEAAVTILSGQETLTTFRFNTKTIDHLFCSICGIEPFARGTGENGEKLYMINVSCLEGASYDRSGLTQWNGADF